jgi:hypothetical protein
MPTEPNHLVRPQAGSHWAQPQVLEGAPTGQNRPDLLIVGGTGRNSGKTELACRIIARHAASEPVVGLKVTAVDRTDGHCPHGGDGCGVCSSLEVPWIVSEELDRRPTKDSCRMLASGARRVFWLRSLRAQLHRGAADLLSYLPRGWVGVCESTSLRQLVEPGLFLMVRGPDGGGDKASARKVAHLADRVVVSNGRSFDLELDRISVVDGRWVLRREGCAVVIGGADAGSGADRAAALSRTRASLEPQFDRVVAGPRDPHPGRAAVPPAELSGRPDEWCLVTPPLSDGVPPGLVNALFRRRSGLDVVVATARSGSRDICLALCRRALLPEVTGARGWSVGAVSRLGDRWKVGELQWQAPGSYGGSDAMPEPGRRTAAEAP